MTQEPSASKMKLGEYEVLGTIGQGGMGTVVRARAPDGGEVAVKLLMSTKVDRIRRFNRERRLLEKLGRDQGFVPILDWGDSQLGPFFVMPLLTGGSLNERLDQGALGVEATLTLIRSLATAMGKAHRQGIVHRDLKPDNILFDAEGNALIADLGLAKHFKRGQEETPQTVGVGRLSSTGEARGTFGYMAPEQIRDSKSVGPACDVFALGAILYECLTGEPAFPGSTIIEVLARVTEGELPALEGRTDVPPWLKDVLHQSMAFDAKERPQSGAALAKALKRGARGARRKVRWTRRRRAAFVGVALGLVVGLGWGERLRPYLPAPVLNLWPSETAPVGSNVAPVDSAK